MWHTNTLWFDLAVLMSVYTVGTILFGHFEEHRPKWRRLLKVTLSISLMLGLNALFGRAWTFSFFAVVLFLGVVVIHGWWLPKHGINGWTGEPKEKYYALIKARK